MKKKSIIPYEGALLNPRRDSTFKALFSGESDDAKLALKSFLEAVLEAEISNIQLAPNELSGDSDGEKQPRFDITCTMDGEKVNIEMQNFDTFVNYANRVEYYVSHLLNHYSPRSQKWKDMTKVYQVSVLNFVFDTTTEEAVSQYQMRTKAGRMLNSRLNVFILELPKLAPESGDVEKLTPAERWCTFLRYADNPEKTEFIKSLCNAEAGIMAASTVLSQMSQDEAAWLAETARDMAERDYLDLVGAVEDANAEAAEAKAEAAEAKAETAHSKAELDEAKAKLAESLCNNVQFQAELARAKAEIAERLGEISEWENELAVANAELAGAKNELADVNAELADVNAKLADKQSELADAQAELERLRAQLAELKS